jgi:hypothetical protein
MNKQMKHVLITGLVMLGIGAVSQAATTDTMQVSVSPTVTYSVSISSPFVQGYVFGNVSLNSTTLSTVAITLNTTGSTGPEFFGLSISNTSGNWTATVGAPGQDTFRMGAAMAATQPLMANTSTYLSVPPFSGAAQYLYSQGAATAVAGTQKVWLRLEMPTSLNLGTTGSQTMTLTATAQSS